jgi:CheY-like chemotaxis protein
LGEGFIKNKKILVIEDEPIIRRICSRTLALHGFEVEEIDNGATALNKVINQEYDAYLSDISMPGLNGIQLCLVLKEKYPEKLERFVFTTGDMFNQDVKNFVITLANPVLPKPFLPDELVTVIKQVVESNFAQSDRAQELRKS